MRTLLVTSTAESTGKTAVAVALGLLAEERGLDVAYMKPKGTRLQSNVGKTLDNDPMLAREVLGLDAEMHEMEPVVYSPTFVEGAIRGREKPDELHERVREAFETVSEGADFVVVEGGGKHTTGGAVELTDPDVADLLDAEPVLVTDYGVPGDVDDVLAAAADFGPDVSVVFNRVADAVYDDVETDVTSFLRGRDVPVRGVVPRQPDLAGVTVADLADEIGGDLLTEAPTDAVVERFSVGAMGADEALSYFRRTKDAAVVTGGDRTDIHTAALEAPGVKCLVLTGGHRPSGAVLGKAEERGVPVVLVSADTVSAIERLEAVISGGRTRDERTVARMRDLLYEHADVETLVGDA